MWTLFKAISSQLRHGKHLGVLLSGIALVVCAGSAVAQTVDVRQWRGETAITRQPEQVFAATTAEWRSLWSRVGLAPPDHFEPGRTCAVGIFLGMRAGSGYSINILSASRRRDRIMVVFEERMPDDIMMAQRLPPGPAPRSVSGGLPGAMPGGAPGFAPGASASFAPQGGVASLPPPPPRPVGPPTSPWAIVLLPRADLPVTVEQRLFR